MNGLCIHFGACGGCSLQGIPRDEYVRMKHETVTRSLAQHGFEDVCVEQPKETPPYARRRATVAFAMAGANVEIGFRSARSHDIIDMRECLVLKPSLLSLIASFRGLAPSLLLKGQQGELSLTACENGVDVVVQAPRKVGRDLLPTLADWARRNNVVRIVVNGDIAVQFEEPIVSFAGVAVAIPPNVFLQPTAEGERFLQDETSAALVRATRIVDLFAGCGTFTFSVSRRASVHAVDSDKPALSALQGAARKAQKLRPVTIEARDLFKLPLQPVELNRFDAVILDPPRAGASAQAAMLAKASVRRMVHVSCNPETFARDARILADGGFRIVWIKPVDQFLWSSHIELVALLERR
jgi:23S rRNA (uracil1939-C5)-methyltransferase